MNCIQFQSGLSLSAFLEQLGTETQPEAALEKACWSEGFRCPHCGQAAPYVLRNSGRKTFWLFLRFSLLKPRAESWMGSQLFEGLRLVR